MDFEIVGVVTSPGLEIVSKFFNVGETYADQAVHAVFGHVLGEQAPGLKDDKLLGPVIHHMNLGQGLAMQALRAGGKDLKVGTTMALQPCRPAGGPWAIWNRLASDGLDALWNGAWLDPLFKGTYPKAMDDFLVGVVREGDLAAIRQPVDFLGVNYYAPAYVRLDLNAPGKIAQAAPPKGAELDAFGRHIDPSGLFEMLNRVRRDYGAPPMLVTENGCSDPFSPGPAILNDQFRITYLRRHLQAVLAAREAGCDVRGYFEWTLIDNFEWDLGYTSKFGLVAMAIGSAIGIFGSYTLGLSFLAFFMLIGTVEIAMEWKLRHQSHLLPLDRYGQIFSSIWYVITVAALVAIMWYFAHSGDEVLSAPMKILRS